MRANILTFTEAFFQIVRKTMTEKGRGRKTAEEAHRRNMEPCSKEDGAPSADAVEKAEETMDLGRQAGSIVAMGIYVGPMTARMRVNPTLASITEDVLKRTGQRHGRSTIRKMLRKRHYSLQKNRKHAQVGKESPQWSDYRLA